jgi:hypothetical protein
MGAVAAVVLIGLVPAATPVRATTPADHDTAAVAAREPDRPADRPGATRTAAPSAPPAPRVHVAAAGEHSWAVLHRPTGTLHSSPGAGRTSYTESVVKIWLATDHLRRAEAADRGPSRTRLRLLSRMIRDSNDRAADVVWSLNGGDAGIRRMISACDLEDTKVYPDWWSKTRMSARDAVRLGHCVADPATSTARWSTWLLGEMRGVRGKGRFGIVDALPPDIAAKVAIKNGWFMHGFDGHWRVNCLAVHDEWAIAVLTRYERRHGFRYGGTVCADVARQVFAQFP